MENHLGEHRYNDWDEQPDPPHQGLYLSSILRYLKEAPGGVVLDAGCGDGNFAESLAMHGFELFGLDMSESGIRRAQARNVGHFVQASMYEALTDIFPVSAFDAIVAVETVEHLYSPVTFAKRAYDALHPGGKLIVTTPYWGYFKNVLLAVTGRLDGQLTAMWEGGHIKHWSRSSMNQLLTGAGFVDIQFEGRGRFAPFWKGMINVGTKPAPRE